MGMQSPVKEDVACMTTLTSSNWKKAWTALSRTTPTMPARQTTTTMLERNGRHHPRDGADADGKARGHVKIPARDDEPCPKCLAENAGRKVYVWRVADRAGLRYECDQCGHGWRRRDVAD